MNYKIKIMIKLLKPRFLSLFTWTVFLSLFIISCEKDKAITEDKPDQLFRPVLFEALVDGNNITFNWVPIKGASYLLEIIRKDDASLNPQVFTIDSAHTYLVGNLYSKVPYSARIKAMSKNAGIKDSEYQEIQFTTGIENIFFAVPAANISKNKVLLQWDVNKEVSAITVKAGTSNTITLIPAEKLAGEKYIEGLLPNTSYTFTIYLGDMLRGTITAKTLN